MPEENPNTFFMVSLIIQQLYREILSVADENGGVLKNRCVFFCDEFGTLPKIDSAEMMFSASRSRRLQTVPIIQSFAQLEKNYGKEGADVIIDNTQLTIFGGFAPNSTSAEVLSKALGSRTVMSGSVSRSKNDPSQSLQMIERPLMTPDELKSLPKGTFVVMKTGFYPMKVKLKLFFKWGIKFEEKYEVMENGNREVHYANRSELFNNIIQTYCPHYLEQTVTDSDFDEASGEKKKKNGGVNLSGTTMVILSAFVAYLLLMIVIGVVYMKKTSSSEDYFLGGRGLNAWVAALSAQASDMSGWLLMGLPGAIYSLGTGQIWIAVGLFIGTVLNWVCISHRLRKYTIAANNSLTIPAFLENRFQDKKRILLLLSSIVIVIFFLVYTASALAAGGKLFNTVFGIDYHIALAIGAAVILCYTFMGGFMAVCVTDFVQGTLMLIGLLIVPLVAYLTLSGSLSDLLTQSGAPGGAAAFLNPFENGERPYTFVEIFSQLAWGLGYCGMPHILTRFMAVKSEKELKKSSAIAIVWDILSLTAACFIGIIGRAYLLPTVLGENGASSSESVFIEMINKLFSTHLGLPFIGGIFLCGILAAIMSTADSQLLVTASAASEDLYHQFIKKDADSKEILAVARFTVIVVSVLAFVIAWNPNSSIMGLVSNAWAGLGAAFGPTVVMSLFWRRTNLAGAVAGIVSGGLTVIVWDYIPLAAGQTLGSYTGLYSLAVGFAVSLAMIIIFSLATKAPSKEITDVFDKVAGK